MQIKKGIPVSPGVAISRAVVLDAEDLAIPRRPVAAERIGAELRRLHDALEASRRDVEQLRDQTAASIGKDVATIFNAHLAMLQDAHLTEQFENAIKQRKVTAEFGVYSVMRSFADKFGQMDNAYLRERAHDVWDLERRILRQLIGTTHAELGQLTHDAVVVAHDLTPSQTAALDKKKIKALATDIGGRTSHTAILAHALGIPAIVGLENVTKSVNQGDTVIINGNRGIVIIDPDAAQLMEHRQSVLRFAELETNLDDLAREPAVTKDGTSISLMANIEFASEIQPAIDKGAEGIGLYRTEFIFLARNEPPSEQQQFEAYAEAIQALDGKPLTIRTLDLGADKFHGHGPADHVEPNPFLGCRSIRFCLQNLPLFKTQLRAILRSSVAGPIKVMFPLITSILELRQAKMVFQDVMEDLEEQDIPFRDAIPVGIMIEVPSAALQAKMLAREVDFFSIGTNDLIQYTLAVDRGNERIASLYSSAHPAVIQLIRDVCRAGKAAGIEVSLCGEMGGEPEYVMLLLGLGLRIFSITPPAIPEVKKIIRSVSIDHCRRVARKVSTLESEREILNILREETRRVAPEVIAGRPMEWP